MFLSAAGFKRIVTEAFKNGALRLGNDGSGTIIAGTYWAMWVNGGALTKKAMASIIELTGVMPEAGEMLWCTKNGNQLEMKDVRPAIKEVMYNAQEAEEKLKDTGLTIQDAKPFRILQSEENRQIWLVRDDVFRIVSNQNLEPDEESPEGPLLGAYRGAYWINSHMAFMLLPLEKDNKKMLIDYLEKIDVNEYRKLEIPETEKK